MPSRDVVAAGPGRGRLRFLQGFRLRLRNHASALLITPSITVRGQRLPEGHARAPARAAGERQDARKTAVRVPAATARCWCGQTARAANFSLGATRANQSSLQNEAIVYFSNCSRAAPPRVVPAVHFSGLGRDDTIPAAPPREGLLDLSRIGFAVYGDNLPAARNLRSRASEDVSGGSPPNLPPDDCYDESCCGLRIAVPHAAGPGVVLHQLAAIRPTSRVPEASRVPPGMWRNQLEVLAGGDRERLRQHHLYTITCW